MSAKRDAYLTQSDPYATDRDRVAFLLVLDLRTAHATAASSLYALRESFWVETRAADAQIEGAHADVVVVRLFPGNQPTRSAHTS